MILHQWDIIRVRIRAEDMDEHPAVILSREEWCQDARQSAGFSFQLFSVSSFSA